MLHQMTLYNGPFEAIQSGHKTIEMRLYDEKRKKLQIGDEIVFTNLDTKETLRVRVKGIYVYKNFKELYTHFSPLLLGYKKNEKATYEDMYFYYSKENIDKNGVCGIEIGKI